MPTVAMSPSSTTHSWSLVKRLSELLLAMGHSLLLTYVTVRDERQRHDGRWDRLAAHDQVQFRAVGCEVLADIAHGNRCVQRGSEAAGGDDSGLGAVLGDDGGLGAGRRAAVRADADAMARYAVVKLVAHQRRAR